jgi:hypothetical protein
LFEQVAVPSLGDRNARFAFYCLLLSHTEIWIGRGAEYSRVTSPKMYWFGMAFGAFSILLPTFILWMLTEYGAH